jgi:hypothetical protein
VRVVSANCTLSDSDYHCWWWQSVCTKGSDVPNGLLQLKVAAAQLKLQDGIQALASLQLASKTPEPTESSPSSTAGSEKTGADISKEVAKIYKRLQLKWYN